MRISDWSSDVCSSDLMRLQFLAMARRIGADHAIVELDPLLIKRDQHLPCVGGEGVSVKNQHRSPSLCVKQPRRRRRAPPPQSRRCRSSSSSSSPPPRASRLRCRCRPSRPAALAGGSAPNRPICPSHHSHSSPCPPHPPPH